MKKANSATILLILLAVSSFASLALAQDYQQPSSAPPSSTALQPEPGVGHISLIHGEVSMLRGDSGDWASTTLNTPLVRGDQVATGDKSRTEIQLDYANVVRLSSRSQVKIADLTRTHIQLQLSQGYANFTTLKGSEADAEIDTPNVAVRPVKHGRYRIQVNSDAETDVIVREGEAEITTPQGSTTLKEGQQITVRGIESPEYRIGDAPGTDDWDRWNKDRDKWIRDAEGWRRTNRYYTGVNDLDAHGHWAYVPGYGWVWSPYQTAGWAPYQYGRWVWEPYYGWTWVSYEPWGWAPYHYGRWFLYSGSWFWWPGPVHVHYRPLWAPAYVAFIGFGHHANFGFGFGSIGWIPCGPHDYFYPWYGRGFNRIHVTNIVNVTNITNVTNIRNVNNVGAVPPLGGVRGRQPLISNVRLAMTDAHVRQAVTTVAAEDFGRGVAPSRHQGIDEASLKQAQVVSGNLPVVPTRESLMPTNRGTIPAVATATPKTSNRFFMKNQPPAGPPSFQEQANKVQEVIRVHAGGAQTTAGDQQVGPGGNRGKAGTGLNPSLGAQTTVGDQQVGPGGNRANAGAGLNTSLGAQTTAGDRQVGPGSEKPEGAKPTVSVSPGVSSAGHDGWNTFGKPRENGHYSGSEAQTSVAQNGSNSGSTQPASGQNSGSNNQPQNSGRGEWRKFGNRNQGTQPAPTSTPAERGPGSTAPTPMPMDRNPGANSGRGGQQNEGQAPKPESNNSEWHRFPQRGQGQQDGNTTAPRPTPVEPAPPARTETEQRHDRTSQPSSDQSGWHRFPSGGNSTTRPPDAPKPPLSVDKPIVVPRNEPRPAPPAPRNEPRYSPPSPAPRMEPPTRSAPPAPAPRMEPRPSPPAPRSEPRSAPSGGGSGGGGKHDGGSEPKSNSGHHGKDN